MFKIKNWSSYQSYKDRKPPWIRFHKSLLDDYEFQSLSVGTRALLPMLWLLASEDEDPTSGIVNSSYKAISFRLRVSEEEVDKAINEAEKSGFIIMLQDRNETVTKPYKSVTPETETETETEKRQSNKTTKGISAFRESDLSEMSEWFSKNAPSVDKNKLRTKIIDWCESKGKTYKDYFAAMRTWANKEHSQNVEKGWKPTKTPVDRYNPYAHLLGEN